MWAGRGAFSAHGLGGGHLVHIGSQDDWAGWARWLVDCCISRIVKGDWSRLVSVMLFYALVIHWVAAVLYWVGASEEHR